MNPTEENCPSAEDKVAAVEAARRTLTEGNGAAANERFRPLATRDFVEAYLSQAQPAGILLCEELLREWALCECRGRLPKVFPDEAARINGGSADADWGPIKARLAAGIGQDPLTGEPLFGLQGLIAVLEGDSRTALISLSCAALLAHIHSRDTIKPCLYDMMRTVLYYTTGNFDRLSVTFGIKDQDCERLSDTRAALVFLFRLVLVLLGPPAKPKAENKSRSVKTEVSRFSDGKVKSEFRLVNGERDGTAKIFNHAGTLLEKAVWKKGHLVHCQLFQDDGTPLEGKKTRVCEAILCGSATIEAVFVRGEVEGRARCFRPDHANAKMPCCEGNFKKGRPHGEFTWFSATKPAVPTSRRTYRNGEIVETVEFEPHEGPRERRIKYRDSSIVRVETFERGELVYERDYGSESEVTFEKTYSREKNGKASLRTVHAFLGDAPHGLWCQYGPMGNLESETPYFRGKISGFFKKYHNNGSLASIHSCHDDEYEKLSATCDANGKPVAVTLFDIPVLL